MATAEADKSKMLKLKDDLEAPNGALYVPYRNSKLPEKGTAPDGEMYADKHVKLAHGTTSYYVVEPLVSTEVDPIVCIHGFIDSSFIFRDLAEILAKRYSAKVFALDLYGHGRAPWTGVKCSLEAFVTQLKSFLDALNLTRVRCLIGYDIGAAIAAGFHAKYRYEYPQLIGSLCLYSPAGLGDEYNVPDRSLLTPFVLGEVRMALGNAAKYFDDLSNDYFVSVEDDSGPHALIQKFKAVLSFQVQATPGFTGAFLSTLRHFPLTKMQELYYLVAQDASVPVCFVTGDSDAVTPALSDEDELSTLLPQTSSVHSRTILKQCGHCVLLDAFDATMQVTITFLDSYAGLCQKY